MTGFNIYFCIKQGKISSFSTSLQGLAVRRLTSSLTYHPRDNLVHITAFDDRKHEGIVQRRILAAYVQTVLQIHLDMSHHTHLLRQHTQALIVRLCKSLKLFFDSIHDRLASFESFCTNLLSIKFCLLAIVLYSKESSYLIDKPHGQGMVLLQGLNELSPYVSKASRTMLVGMKFIIVIYLIYHIAISGEESDGYLTSAFSYIYSLPSCYLRGNLSVLRIRQNPMCQSTLSESVAIVIGFRTELFDTRLNSNHTQKYSLRKKTFPL